MVMAELFLFLQTRCKPLGQMYLSVIFLLVTALRIIFMVIQHFLLGKFLTNMSVFKVLH